MVDEVITKQELIDAQKDAQSLDDFINGGDEQIVITRLLKEYPTLANAIRQIYEKGGKFYPTLADANADIANIRTDVYVITGDSGAYYKATAEATSLTKSPYDPLTQAKLYTDDFSRNLETNRPQNPNKFTIDQVLFNVMPKTTVGSASVVYRNGIKQLKLVSATTGGSIIAQWDFDASLFSREFSASVCVEGLTAGSGGLFAVQQFDAAFNQLSITTGASNVTSAYAKNLFKVTVPSVAVNAKTIRINLTMQTTTTREMYVHSPFIADGTNAEFIAPLESTAPLKTDIAKLNAAFDEVAPKNKFNPALAVDGKTISFDAGSQVTYADGIAFGKQAVEAGKTYTFWIPSGSAFKFYPVIYTYNAAGNYIGVDHSIPASGEVVNPNPPTNIIYSDTNHTVTFTIPSGSAIAFIQMRTEYAAHTTSDFNTLVNSMQLEFGSVKTNFEAYNPTGPKALVLKESALPVTGGTTSAAENTFTVTLDGTDAYIRTKFSETLDLVQQVRYGTNNVWSNNVINPWSVRTVAKSTAKDGVIAAFSSGTVLASQGDDAAPLHYNGTYIGANHGAFIVHEVTVNAHGKTYADVGSRWTQGANTFTIVRIVDANKLWLVSQNVGTTYWQFITSSLSGLTLTHSTGATNTASFTPSASTLTQLFQAINNHTKKIIADGFKELTSSGVYDVKYVEFIDSYEIMNPVAILSYLHGRVGTTTEQSLKVNSIATDVKLTYNYRFTINGTCTVIPELVRKAEFLNPSFAGFTQANALTFAGKTLLQYANKINPVTVNGTAYDLENVIDATANTAVINMLKANWRDATNPPDRMAQIVKNGSIKEFGMVVGYSLTRGATKPSIRQNIADAGFFNNPQTKKVYPKALGTTFGTVVNAVAYRAIYNPSVLPESTVYTWYEDNSEIFVILDIHQSASMLKLPLPAMFNGKSAEVIDSHANFTLHSEIVSDGGLLCSVVNNYASVMIRLK